jgi:hypothetical protein
MKMKCRECKHEEHCNETGRLYGLPKYQGGCKEYECKQSNISDTWKQQTMSRFERVE